MKVLKRGALWIEEEAAQIPNSAGVLVMGLTWMVEFIRLESGAITFRRDCPFDIIAGAPLPKRSPKRAAQIIQSYEKAGATWWLEEPWSIESFAKLRAFVRLGSHAFSEFGPDFPQ